MVCVASMLVGYCWVTYTSKFNDKTSEDYISSSIFISIAVLMMAYLVAESFFNVFHVAIDTILMSYCIVSLGGRVPFLCVFLGGNNAKYVFDSFFLFLNILHRTLKIPRIMVNRHVPWSVKMSSS